MSTSGSDGRTGWAIHVGYSIQAVGELPAHGIAAIDNGDKWAADSFMEAFLVHARGIIEFVAGRPVKPGHPPRQKRQRRDITPDDFLTGWLLPKPEKYDVYLNEIDKHLAHFSKVRGTAGHAPSGYCTDLAKDLLDDLEAFASAVEADGDVAIANGFHATIEQAREALVKTDRPWPMRLYVSESRA